MRLGVYRYFFKDGQLNQIKDNEVIAPEAKIIPVIQESTGFLLSIPIRLHDLVQVQSLINPQIKLGQQFDLVSEYDEKVNGRYKCTMITIQGDSRSSEWFMVVKGIKRLKKETVEVT